MVIYLICAANATGRENKKTIIITLVGAKGMKDS